MRKQEVRKWLSFVASIWVMAISATNFDFSIYSSKMKIVMSLNQMELNNLAVASDVGKLLGWVSGLACLALPNWTVLFIASMLGLGGYGMQWLVASEKISPLPYEVVYFCCMMAGNSICWLNTVCFRVAIANFPSLKGIAIALNTSYSGLTTVIYTILASIFSPGDPSIYLLLNAIVPFVFCVLGAMLIDMPQNEEKQAISSSQDKTNMYIATAIALVTSFYSIAYNFLPHGSFKIQVVFAAVLVALLLGLMFLPLRMLAWEKREERHKVSSVVDIESCTFPEWDCKIIALTPPRSQEMKHLTLRDYIYHINKIDLDLERPRPREIIMSSPSSNSSSISSSSLSLESEMLVPLRKSPVVGEEHKLSQLLSSVDFWLYYFVYLLGATVSIVYINNMGQIVESLGYSKTPTLVSLLTSAGFLGRIASGLPDYFEGINKKLPRTAWLGIWTLPMVPTLFLMSFFGQNSVVVYVSATIMGACSGAATSVAAPISAEMFGKINFGVNHNVLISNIAVGSLVFGNLAGFMYDREVSHMHTLKRSYQCYGTQCYKLTILSWACLASLACLLSIVLWMRTRKLRHARK